MAILAAAGIAAGASLLGSYMSSNASSDAAQTQANSAAQANALQQQMYNQNVQRLSPWTTAGGAALGNLQGLMGSNGMNGALTTPFSATQFQQSPGYQWQLQQGLNAVQNSAAARGGLGGGNTLKSLMTYGQGLANQDYQQALQNYQNWQQQVYGMNAGLANSGENAAGMTAGLGANAATQMGSNTIGAGNALAAGRIGGANAWNAALGNIGQLGMYAAMSRTGNPYSGINTYSSPLQINPGNPYAGGITVPNISMPMAPVQMVGGY